MGTESGERYWSRGSQNPSQVRHQGRVSRQNGGFGRGCGRGTGRVESDTGARGCGRGGASLGKK